MREFKVGDRVMSLEGGIISEHINEQTPGEIVSMSGVTDTCVTIEDSEGVKWDCYLKQLRLIEEKPEPINIDERLRIVKELTQDRTLDGADIATLATYIIGGPDV